MKPMRVMLLLAALFAAPAWADEMLMVRSGQDFPEAMMTLQESIAGHGYTVSRVQRVDIGLTAAGFESDRYRVVFFGVPEEVRRMSARYPGLVPYLPLQITLFAEGGETLAATFDPTLFNDMVEPEDRSVLKRWRDDAIAILGDLRS